ncbi:unnamed protein product [Boreogadus saida]
MAHAVNSNHFFKAGLYSSGKDNTCWKPVPHAPGRKAAAKAPRGASQPGRGILVFTLQLDRCPKTRF